MTAIPLSAWSLRTTTDPRKLIPGSAAGIRGDADDVESLAQSMAATRDAVTGRTETPSWRGQAYDGWIVRRDDLATSHDAVSQVLAAAGWALRAHADVLEWAQMRAGVAVRLWAQGEREGESGTPALAPGATGFGLSIRDAGEATRERAVSTLEEARSEVAASGAALARMLDEMSGGLPDGRFHAGDFFAGIGSWFSGIASTIWQLSATRLMLDTSGWARSVDERTTGAAGVWDLLTRDPLNAPATLLDLETLEDRPGRWWGGLAPDIALTAVGGLGAGVKATSLLQAGRWTRLGTASDALAAASRAEVAGSIGDVGSAVTRLGAALARIEERWPNHAVLHETSGQTGAWNTALHRPLPNTVYVVDDAQQLYATDNLGRVSSVEAEWKGTPSAEADMRRNGYQQQVAGRDWRQPSDVGGHLAAAGGGGPGEGVNLVAMDKVVNGSGGAYGRMEADIRSLADQYPDSTIKLEVDLEYPGQSSRPDHVSASYYRDGEFVDSVEFDQ